MRRRNIVPLSLILMFFTVMVMDMRSVQATNTYEYELYVDGFDSTFVGWITHGTNPWLDRIDFPSNYTESSQYSTIMGFFTFDNITLPSDQVITKVLIEGYTRSADLEIDADVYNSTFGWVGSLWGTQTWGWHIPEWYPVLSDVDPDTLTVAGLNDFKVALHYWTPLHVSLGPFEIDCLRLKVYTAVPVIIDIDPDEVKLDNNAKYLTCYIEPYTTFGASDIDPSTVKLDGIPALSSPTQIDDNIPPPNGNEIDDLMVKFNMVDVKYYIVNVLLNGNPPGPNDEVDVTLKVTGLWNGYPFSGNCTIKVKG